MRQIENAIRNYHSWTFKETSEAANGFILMCMVAGFTLFLLGPPAWVPFAFLLVAAPGVPILNRAIVRHPGENFLRSLDSEYLTGYSENFTETMRKRGVPEGMIFVDVGLLWIYKQGGDHHSLFLHMLNLQTKLEKIDDVSGVHEAELPAVPTSEGLADGEEP